MVGVALDGNGSADALLEEPLDDHDPPPLVQVRLDAITELNRRGRLDRLAVDVDVAAATRCRSLGSCLGEPDGVQPLVDADGVDAVSLPALLSSLAGEVRRTLLHERRCCFSVIGRAH